jgi:hypothetical protein
VIHLKKSTHVENFKEKKIKSVLAYVPYVPYLRYMEQVLSATTFLPTCLLPMILDYDGRLFLFSLLPRVMSSLCNHARGSGHEVTYVTAPNCLNQRERLHRTYFSEGAECYVWTCSMEPCPDKGSVPKHVTYPTSWHLFPCFDTWNNQKEHIFLVVGCISLPGCYLPTLTLQLPLNSRWYENKTRLMRGCGMWKRIL